MIDYFAGKYFAQEGIINAKTLDEIMTRQGVVHKNFKKLGENPSSFLDEKQITFIKLLQHNIDEKLSDLAFEYGGIDEERLKSTVKKQEILNTAFFDQLIIEGIITPEKIIPLLEKMQSYYSLGKPGISRNLKHDFDIILGGLINTGESFNNIYINIAVKYILRFIGANIKFGKTDKSGSYIARRAAIQKVVTDPRRYFLGLCGEKEVLQSLNDCLALSFPHSPNSTRYCALFAFLDCISNIFQCLIMNEKNVLLVDDPDMYKYVTVTSGQDIYTLQLTVMDMPFEIITGHGDKPNFAVISHNL